MSRLLEDLETLVSAAFERAGLDRNLGQVAFSKRLDLCQFQCNGAMIAGKKLAKESSGRGGDSGRRTSE